VNSKPYEGLTPDAVLDALQSIGLRGDGRLLTLNSYENRVFQVVGFMDRAQVRERLTDQAAALADGEDRPHAAGNRLSRRRRSRRLASATA